MPVRLSAEQEQIIIDGIMDGQSVPQISKNAKVSKGTVIRIHRHIRQVGHYKGFTISGKVPALGSTKIPAITRTARGELGAAIVASLRRQSAAALHEIALEVLASCPLTTRLSIQNSLLIMLKKGTVNYLNGYYFLKGASLTDEVASRIQSTRAERSRGWSKFQTQEV